MNDLFHELQGKLPENPGGSPEDEKRLLSMLEDGIQQLLSNNTEKLFQILYRLDIPESKVQAILKNHLPENWANRIAGLILEREKERLKWRAKYQSEQNSDSAGEEQPE